MTKFTQQFAEAKETYSDAINTFVKLANESLENAQKITALQYQVATNFIESSTNATKDLLAAKDPVQATNVLKDYATASVEAAVDNGKEVFNVLNKSHASFKDVANTSFKNASDTILNSIDQVAKVNPSWSKAATASVNQILEATNKAQVTFEKVAEQVSTIANKNVEAATNATLNTIKKASAKANGFATA